MTFDEDAESLIDFIGDLSPADTDDLPDDTDLIFDAFENDDFWLPLARNKCLSVQVPFGPTNAEPSIVAYSQHKASSSGSHERQWDLCSSSQSHVGRLDGQASGAFHVNTHGPQRTQVTTRARKEKTRTVPSVKHSNTNWKRKRRSAATFPVAPLSAYNFFFRVERVRLLEENSCSAGNRDSCLQVENAVSFYAHILSGSTREFQNMVLQDQWGRDPTVKRKHRKSHGRISFQSLARQISQSWRHLPEDFKQVFHAISARDFERFEQEKGTLASDADQHVQK